METPQTAVKTDMLASQWYQQDLQRFEKEPTTPLQMRKAREPVPQPKETLETEQLTFEPR